jgi:hypothetical protein
MSSVITNIFYTNLVLLSYNVPGVPDVFRCLIKKVCSTFGGGKCGAEEAWERGSVATD